MRKTAQQKPIPKIEQQRNKATKPETVGQKLVKPDKVATMKQDGLQKLPPIMC
jgi:hypothetical protein